MGMALFFVSCSTHFKKTNATDSLLDYELKKEPGENHLKAKSTTNLFKSNSTAHFGIDISHFQGDIMKMYTSQEGLSFVICKATQGNYFVDPDFRNNWNEIKEKGLIRGTYHFYDCKISPEDQATFFAIQASDIGTADIAPILDIEQGSMSKTVSGEQMEADILVFLKRIEMKFDRKPIIYTDYEFAQEYLKNSEFANYDLWLAEYSGSTQPLVPDIWKGKGYKIWQKSATYTIESKKADLDEYKGLLQELVK